MLEKKLKKLFWAMAEGMVKKGATSSRLRPSPSILILRPDRLGDFLLSAPSILALAMKAGPSPNMTIVAGPRNRALARVLFPKARVLVFRPFFPARLLLFLRLWLESYDATIDFHSYPFSTTSALMSLLSGSPLRVGFWAGGDFSEYRELSKKVYNHGVDTPPEDLHESRKSSLLVRRLYPGAAPGAFHAPQIPVPAKIIREVQNYYRGMGATPKTKVLGLHPTLQKVDNRWSMERYVELAGRLGEIRDVKIILVHGSGEKRELKRFQAMVKNMPHVFPLPSDDLFFILEAAKKFRLLVCNDSGLMHLCAGVTPILAVFGPSDPRRWGPLPGKGFRHRIFHGRGGHCDSVQVSEVERQVLKVLKI